MICLIDNFFMFLLLGFFWLFWMFYYFVQTWKKCHLKLFIYLFWLGCVFVAIFRLSPIVGRGYSLVAVLRLLLVLASPVAEQVLGVAGFDSCCSWALEYGRSSYGTWTQFPHDLLDLSSHSRDWTMFPALAGGFLTTGIPEKSLIIFKNIFFLPSLAFFEGPIKHTLECVILIHRLMDDLFIISLYLISISLWIVSIAVSSGSPASSSIGLIWCYLFYSYIVFFMYKY